MEGFHVAIRTSPGLLSGTYNTLWISLVGSQCDCPPVKVLPDGQCLMPDSTCTFVVKPERKIGTVVLVCLRLEARPGFPDQSWHCLDVQLKQRDEAAEVERFPCNKWITTADGDVELRSDRVCLVTWEKLQTLREHRARDLQKRQQQIRWGTFAEGSLRCIDMTSVQSLGPNLSFTRQSPGINLNYVRGFANRTEPWSSLEELEIVFIHNGKDNAIAKYVRAHWKDDTFFGYQCLNGCNPLQIRKIHHLPPNLQLTSEMLRDFLPVGSSLEQEMERGAIFLLDYGILDQLPANILNGKQTYLAAPLCLLHYNQYGEMKPIAIQLQKNAGPQNPVFLPSDSEPDWLLAKMWVKNADFQVHQLLSHLLRTHLLGEVCCIATLRRLPEIHPLHQLLMPHIKTCLQINIQARGSLLSTNGVFDKAIGCGLNAAALLLARGTEQLRYSSMCVPDDLRERGLDTLTNCYYAQDALRVWNALHRFVGSWVDLYYSNDQEVQQDWELQSWIQEIFTEGFLSLAQTGFPQSFQTTAELSTFLTMVIFSSSALHAAVNFSQVDFNLWMPNCPAAMLRPPPQVKGSVTEEELLSFLPDVNSTCSVLTILLMLSQPAADYVALCHYREQYFSSGAPCRLVEAVLKELKDISEDITKRNSKMDIPYPYLSPDNIENSVAI
ncbi:polyunsaturated fatty acid lipoxygenase ALOX15B [Astyanax mexicanus]|uniref:Arachidonate 15-lipoxygenase B-like n=1 Tax=Astyanax mexicanus TaxID=7994 RepID=A0A8B9HUK3_ASTMX|nr:polyunsaturated fatty acid lipoxygenase ALOX15B [Astyanax mexicanus]KAG9265687.1 arachidonate 15-lipoxygenase B-like [Astyanax mexicanus]